MSSADGDMIAPASPAVRTSSTDSLASAAELKGRLVRVLRNAILLRLARVVLHFVAFYIGPKSYTSLPGDRRHRTDTYLFSTITAALGALIGWCDGRAYSAHGAVWDILAPWAALHDCRLAVSIDHGDNAERQAVEQLEDSKSRGPSRREIASRKNIALTTVEWLAGYMLQDTLYLLANAREYPVDIAHHAGGLFLFSCLFRYPDILWSFVTPLLRIEVSTIFLNLLWFAREYPQSLFATVEPTSKYSFALLFAITRVWYFPALFISMCRKQPLAVKTLGKGGSAMFVLLIVMQWYWFVGIVKKVLKPGLSA